MCRTGSPTFLTAGYTYTEIDPAVVVRKRSRIERHIFPQNRAVMQIFRILYMPVERKGVYSSHKSHELCYAVSDRPDKGFTYGGTIVSNGDVGLNGRKAPVNVLGNNPSKYLYPSTLPSATAAT